MTILKNTDFIIGKTLGLCEILMTISTNEFHYADFVFAGTLPMRFLMAIFNFIIA